MTDLVKADFERWFEYYKNIEVYNLSIDGEYVSLEDIWDNLPEAFKWGVYVDYFDSCEIEIEIAINFWQIFIDGIIYEQYIGVKSRSEKRAEALKIASQIRHEQLS